VRAEPVLDSTRGPALPYPAGMHSSTILIPLLMILANDVRCKDDEPAGGEFGEPCGETPCAEGLKCYIGYCEEKCADDSDCQPVEGYRHECEAGGLCHIYCDESSLACPQTLATPLECGIGWCAGAS
jgi:hypothetical protein